MIDIGESRQANWACGALSITILTIRLGLSRYNKNPFDTSFILCIASVLLIVARMTVIQYSIDYGTVNDLPPGQNDLSLDEYTRIKTGTTLALVVRVLSTTIYWLQVCLLLLFYSHIIYEARRTMIMIMVCWFTVVGTYIAVILATFLECRPFRLYWQIQPRIDRCARAYLQLFLQGISNIILDLMVLIISFPLLNFSHRTLSQSLRLATIYSLGIFCIVVTCIRLASIYAVRSDQTVRSFWASIQVLVSTFVANAPTIYGGVKIAQRKKENQRSRGRSVA